MYSDTICTRSITSMPHIQHIYTIAHIYDNEILVTVLSSCPIACKGPSGSSLLLTKMLFLVAIGNHELKVILKKPCVLSIVQNHSSNIN